MMFLPLLGTVVEFMFTCHTSVANELFLWTQLAWQAKPAKSNPSTPSSWWSRTEVHRGVLLRLWHVRRVDRCAMRACCPQVCTFEAYNGLSPSRS